MDLQILMYLIWVQYMNMIYLVLIHICQRINCFISLNLGSAQKTTELLLLSQCIQKNNSFERARAIIGILALQVVLRHLLVQDVAIGWLRRAFWDNIKKELKKELKYILNKLERQWLWLLFPQY